MKSLLYDVGVRYIKFILRLMALWFFYRGHDAPGGGFAAGVLFAAADLLEIINTGWQNIRLKGDGLLILLGWGLLICIVSGTFAFSVGNPYMTARWIWLGNVRLGSPMLMDFGIFLAVYAIVVASAGLVLAGDEKGSAA